MNLKNHYKNNHLEIFHFDEMKYNLGEFSFRYNSTEIKVSIKEDSLKKRIEDNAEKKEVIIKNDAMSFLNKYPSIYALGNIKSLSKIHIDELKNIHHQILNSELIPEFIKIGTGKSINDSLENNQLSYKQAEYLSILASRHGEKDLVEKEMFRGNISQDNFLSIILKYGYDPKLKQSTLKIYNMENLTKFKSQQLQNNIEGYLIGSSNLKNYEVETKVDYYLDKEGFIHSNSSNYSIVEKNPMTGSQFIKKVKEEEGSLFNFDFDKIKFYQIRSRLFLELSNKWANELSTRTDLSKGLTNNRIDEKRANYFISYEFAEKQYNEAVVEKLDKIYKYPDIDISIEEKIDLFYKDIDLLEHYNLMPEDLAKISKPWIEKHEDRGLRFEDCEMFLKQVNDIGYTFDYYVDAEPYCLRPISFEQQIAILNILKNQEQKTEIIGGKIKDIATESIKSPDYLKKFDNNTQEIIKKYREVQDPDLNPLTSAGRDSQFLDDIFDDIENQNGDIWTKSSNKTKDLSDDFFKLSSADPSSVPDIILNNKLTSEQKKDLLLSKRIDFVETLNDDELVARITLHEDGRLAVFYPSGEEFFIKNQDVITESNDLSKRQEEKENKAKPKKWEINPSPKSDFYIGDLNAVLKLKNKEAVYNFIAKNFGKEVSETLSKNNFSILREGDSFFNNVIYPKAKSIETIKAQFYYFEKKQSTQQWRDIIKDHDFKNLNKEGKISLTHVDYLMENLSKEEMLQMLDELKTPDNIYSTYLEVFERNFEDNLNLPLADKALEKEFKKERYNLVDTVNKSENNKELFLSVGEEYLQNSWEKNNDQDMSR